MRTGGLRRALLPVALCAASLPSGLASADVVHVAGRSVDATGLRTVAQALAAAHVDVPSGRVLSAVSHRPLPGRRTPGQVLLDGVPVAPGAVLRPGSVVTVRRGADVVEPLRAVTEPLQPLDAGLFVGARPGAVRVVEGAVSGETVTRRVVARPSAGRLVRPGAVALTFDDGPDPVWTPRILWLLDRAHVKATFCLVGREAAKHPALVRAIVARGHALCDHTWDHDEQLAQRPAAVVDAELARTQAALRAIGVPAPVLFRAPGGRWTAALEAAARAQGMAPLHWSVDPRDWARPGAAAIVRGVLTHVRPGSVVLLHDGGGSRAQTVAALRVLLTELPKRGCSFVLPR